jgi:hypothetical protein
MRFASLCAATGVALLAVACGRDATPPVTTNTPAGQSSAPPSAAVAERDNALVRVVHAVPAGPSVDVFADDTRVFDGVTFKEVTPYHEVEAERASLTIRTTGAPAGEPIARNSEGLDDGDHYTVFAVPDDDETATLRVVKDDHSPPAPGKARLRVVHAARDAGELDVFAADRKDALVDGVNFQTVSGYAEIDPVAGPVTVRPEGKATPLATLNDTAFAAGRSYTVVVVARAPGNRGLEAFVIEDAPETVSRLP